MATILYKIIRIPNNLTSEEAILSSDVSISEVGKKLQNKISKVFGGSLAIRQVDAGSDNACENELTALSNGYYDVSRFGINFVASPRHADMLMVTGPVSRNMVDALKSAYEATPTPKIIVAVGDDAIDGGIFKDSYAIAGGVDSVIPVDYAIAGDPPTPLQILHALLQIMDDIKTKKGSK